MTAFLPLIDALAWTLLQFAWQGLLIGAATALALALLRDAGPQARYALACAALLCCLAWPALELAGRLKAFGAAGAAPLPGGAASAFADGAVAGHWQPWLVGLWALGAALLALRLLLGLAWVRATRASAPAGDDDLAWQRRLSALALRFGVTRPVRLLVAQAGGMLAVPVTAGCWRPFVIVPAALLSGMPAELLEALLAHEMAHIRRADYLVGLAQNVVEALLFYHPAVWWISGRIRHERELAADALASQVTGEPRRLAKALSELELLQFAPHHLAPSAAGGDLLQRIRALTAPVPASAGRRSAAVVLLAFMLGATALCLAALPQQEPAVAKVASTAPVLDFSTCRKPMYPPASLAAREEGTVRLRMLVGADGKIRDAAIGHSSGHPALDVEARDAIRLCSFHPATRGGKPVDAATEVSYVWTLN